MGNGVQDSSDIYTFSLNKTYLLYAMCRLGYKLDASARRSVVARFLTHSRPCVFPLSLSLLLARKKGRNERLHFFY